MLVGSGLVAGGLVWWLRRSQSAAPSEAPVEPDQDITPEEPLSFEEAPLSVDPAPASNPPSITAQPTARYPAVSSADDWDSVEPEELGEAFLTRATEATADPKEDDDEDARFLEIWKSGV